MNLSIIKKTSIKTKLISLIIIAAIVVLFALTYYALYFQNKMSVIKF